MELAFLSLVRWQNNMLPKYLASIHFWELKGMPWMAWQGQPMYIYVFQETRMCSPFRCYVKVPQQSIQGPGTALQWLKNSLVWGRPRNTGSGELLGGPSSSSLGHGYFVCAIRKEWDTVPFPLGVNPFMFSPPLDTNLLGISWVQWVTRILINKWMGEWTSAQSKIKFRLWDHFTLKALFFPFPVIFKGNLLVL